jgi:hypothetical protein
MFLGLSSDRLHHAAKSEDIPEEEFLHLGIWVALFPDNGLLGGALKHFPPMRCPSWNFDSTVFGTDHANIGTEGDTDLALLAVQVFCMLGVEVQERVEYTSRFEAEANLEVRQTSLGGCRFDEVDVGLGLGVRYRGRVGSLTALHVGLNECWMDWGPSNGTTAALIYGSSFSRSCTHLARR